MIDLRNDDDLQRAIVTFARKNPTHPINRTDRCLRLDQLAPWTPTSSWTTENVAHLQSCQWCQRQGAAWFRIECPSLGALVRFATHERSELLNAAIRFHVEEDQCDRCWSRLNSAWFRCLCSLSAQTRTLVALPLFPHADPGVLAARSGEPDDFLFESEVDPDTGVKCTARIDGTELVVTVMGRPDTPPGTVVEIDLVGDFGSLGVRQVDLSSYAGQVSAVARFSKISPADVRAIGVRRKA